jgi:hypothetical protein
VTLSVVGQSVAIAPGNAPLQLHDRGTLRGDTFTVSGRVRYHHTVGVWDEWYLVLLGQPVWLQIDEGEITLFNSETKTDDCPDFASIEVGRKASFGGYPTTVLETGEAVVAAVVGQIPRDIRIGQGFYYADGVSEGKWISTEYYYSDRYVSVGTILSASDLSITSTP